MAAARAGEVHADEVRLFHETKQGVKGLVDSGITKVPQFMRVSPDAAAALTGNANPQSTPVAVIDLTDLEKRKEVVVGQIRRAAAEVGIFQVVNHGIDKRVTEAVLTAAREFHELTFELKESYYSTDALGKKVTLLSAPRNQLTNCCSWVDILNCQLAPELDPSELPPICRDSVTEFLSRVGELGNTVSELFSEALGLGPNHLNETEKCMHLHRIGLNYYPPCPEPELAMASQPHHDPASFTILLQDQSRNGMLQAFHDGWIDVPPLEGGLVVFVGNLLQVMSNDRLKSAEHRVLANSGGARVSIACFFRPIFNLQTITAKEYGPIKELVSERDPAVYSKTSMLELINFRCEDLKGPHRHQAMSDFKLQ